jgi:hypothetical protein
MCTAEKSVKGNYSKKPLQYIIMQLPRGTFRNIKRHTLVRVLLEELQEMKYTGICTISCKGGNCTVVFNSGKRILAQYHDTLGDAAWDELLKITSEYVDAALSTLDNAQLQLSLEFNKTCRIGKEIRTEKPLPEKKSELQLQSIKNSPLAPAARVQAAMVKNHPKPVLTETRAFNASAIVETLHTSELPKIISDIQFRRATHKQSAAVPQKSPVHAQRQEGEKKSEDMATYHTDTDINSFDADIITFETMDVDSITDKIRGECKTIIKQLQLEHLTDD